MRWLAVYAIEFTELIYTSLMRKHAEPRQNVVLTDQSKVSHFAIPY